MSGILAWTLFLAAGQDLKTPDFTKYDIARERVGHKVVVDAVLLNPLPTELADAKVTVLYFDGEDELKRSKPVAVPRIPAGKSAAFKIEVEQVPNFTKYEIYLEYRGTTRLFLGGDPTKLPALRRPSPSRLSIEAQRNSYAAGEFRTSLTVKNAGETEADDPTLRLIFTGRTGSVVQQAWVRLAEVSPAASLESFDVVLPGVPEHASVKASLVWVVAEGLSLGDSGGPLSKELILRGCRIDRLSGGVARVSGTLINGFPSAVSGVLASFKLGRLDAAYALPGILKTAESRPFALHIPDCPPIETASFTLGFDSASKEALATAPPPQPQSKLLSTEKIDIGQVRLPAVPEKTVEAKAESAPVPAGFRAEIRGLLVVDGVMLKGGKYSGDVYLFRVAFTDGKGAAVQPVGTFSGTIYDGPTALKKIQRIITKESWRVEASRVNSQTVADNTIAFDRKTGELWVAFHRSEGPFEKPRADLELDVEGKGVWSWRGLSEKWQNAPRWPDKPLK